MHPALLPSGFKRGAFLLSTDNSIPILVSLVAQLLRDLILEVITLFGNHKPHEPSQLRYSFWLLEMLIPSIKHNENIFNEIKK